MKKKIKSLKYDSYNECEGCVVRVVDAFPHFSFRCCIVKYVRKDHVNTSHGWKYEKIVKNELSV